jgi:hypothetical protein
MTDRIAIPKSRRMLLSWVNIALHLHMAMFNIGKAVAFVSKKEEDADELIKKAKFIYDRIPETEIPKEYKPRVEYKFCQMNFPELDSSIRGFPQGADQLRQFTFSAIMADEMAFWENAQLMYAASFPTLEGGGKFTAISSPAPGFFKRLVFDRLEDNVANDSSESG